MATDQHRANAFLARLQGKSEVSDHRKITYMEQARVPPASLSDRSKYTKEERGRFDVGSRINPIPLAHPKVTARLEKRKVSQRDGYWMNHDLQNPEVMEHPVVSVRDRSPVPIRTSTRGVGSLDHRNRLVNMNNAENGRGMEVQHRLDRRLESGGVSPEERSANHRMYAAIEQRLQDTMGDASVRMRPSRRYR